MKTSIVILNYNTKEYLRRFLPGLLASCEGQDAEVVVADNASTDGSRELMQQVYPDVKYIQLDQNYGFTGGYNKALQNLDAEYFILINSDIEVPPDWLAPLVQWMDTHPECGACGPKLINFEERDTFEYAGAAGGLVDRYGYPFCRGRIMQHIEKDHGQYDNPGGILWISGACLMVRAVLWKELGGLDSRFFAHMEEIDLCWRMQLRGWKVNLVPQSRVYHIGGGTLPNESPFKLRLNFRNNLLLLENNLAATFVALDSHGPKGPQNDKKAHRKARRRIFVRKCLDGVSSLIFLLKGKWSFFLAVVQAHREYRQLRRTGEIPLNPSVPEGLYGSWIVPRGLFGKK